MHEPFDSQRVTHQITLTDIQYHGTLTHKLHKLLPINRKLYFAKLMSVVNVHSLHTSNNVNRPLPAVTRSKSI